MSSIKCGLVGLPNVGKSTLFNALLKKRVALSANYPFATIEPNVGVVAVPDTRLNQLAEVVKNEEKMNFLPPLVPAVVEFVDIAGLVKGASTGAGLGNQFLGHIREVDAIIHVLRDFDDADIVREGSADPEADRETVEMELALADLQVIDKLIENAKKEDRLGISHRYGGALSPILEEIKANLEQGKILVRYEVKDAGLQKLVDCLPLLTLKPVLYVFNVGEGQFRQKWSDRTKNVEDNELVICARLEEELADLSEEDRRDYLQELGVEETGLERLIGQAYSLLGLISFLTAGKKEVRAWTTRKGCKAPEAAGTIHTDFTKKFIRAEVIEYEKLIEAGSYAAAKQKGWVRTEGRNYEIRDGDVVEFLVGN